MQGINTNLEPTFIQLACFVERWRRLKLIDEDLQALEQFIARNPEGGQVVPGCGGLRKIRFAPPSVARGKRGATRVCYLLMTRSERVYLFTIYAKNVATDLTSFEKAIFQRLVRDIKDSE